MPSVVEQFLSAKLAERLAMVTDGGSAAELQEYLGAEALVEYQRLAEGFDDVHLAGNAPVNVIFLPGVMGSSLNSTGLGGIWWLDVLNRDHLRDLRLTVDGTTDCDVRAQIEPVGVMSTYEGFLAAAHASGDLTCRAHPYDWRKSLRSSAECVRGAIISASDRARRTGSSRGAQHGRTGGPDRADDLPRTSGTASDASCSSARRSTGHRPSRAT